MHGQQLQKFEWLVIKICIHCSFVNSKNLKQQNLQNTINIVRTKNHFYKLTNHSIMSISKQQFMLVKPYFSGVVLQFALCCYVPLNKIVFSIQSHCNCHVHLKLMHVWTKSPF